MKDIIKKIKEDNYFNEEHELVVSGKIVIRREERTNPRRDMLGTEYLIRKFDTNDFGVIETIDDENWDDGLWICEECEVEKVVAHKIVPKCK